MPDLKTVTFDATLKPCPFCGGTSLTTDVTQTDAVHWICSIDCGDCDSSMRPVYDSKSDSEAAADARQLWNTRAPTPAAQSAGQEATDAPSAIWTTEMLASVRKDAETLHSRLSCRPLAGDAAPVNGGAFRKRVCAALMIPEALDDDAVITTVELTDYEFRRLFSESVNGGEQSNAINTELLEAVEAMIEWDAREKDHAVDFYARMDLCAQAFDKARAAIRSYAKEQK
ncbi:hypothetical protein PanNE5_03480 [Pandoraea sp. NE5]|uniref:Lar family restriction alleviation protein n=1 Tax=Pandoraea sp. NE5 TaxID=2904129 RepID=UPI0021C3D5F0|nr:Lar family restriction alleviation protein [Pandoraea sp. NE5]BDD90908.1 hypothetical protein PanNE5_03480 [Pandoraea sp. NE5]